MDNQITATFVRKLDGFAGDARLFRLSSPIDYGYDYDTDGPEGQTAFVVVSAATVFMSGPETYIFAADADGEVVSWGELDGSLRGTLDHSEAIRNAGWKGGAPDA